MQIDTSRLAKLRKTDWVVRPLAHDVADILRDSGHEDLTDDAVMDSFDQLRLAGNHQQQMESLEPLFADRGWTGATYREVAGSLKKAFTSRPALPGQPNSDYRSAALELLKKLAPVPSRHFNTPHELERLGYDPQVAANLLEVPKLVGEIERWADAAPAKAEPRNLYRALALEGGMEGYDPERSGTVNDETFFADSEKFALMFGSKRVEHLPGTKGVMLHCQIPGFMVENSPPQGGDASWPIVRKRNMPDPQRPDLRPFIARMGQFQADSKSVEWKA